MAGSDGAPWAVQLGEYTHELRFDRLPEAVVARAKQCLLDQVGVQVRGALAPHAQPVRRLALSVGGHPESTVVVHGDRTSAPMAAYVNATFGHSIEFDDAHFHAGHPGTVVIPAAMALAEAHGSTGRELLTAVVAGYEIAVRSASLIHQAMLDIGWHTMMVSGVFGAAAASGSILGLDAATITNSLGIVGSSASGTMEYDKSGGTIYALHGGLPARSGLEAALLAADGMTGPPTIFEGPRGIFRLFGRGPDVAPPHAVGDQFEILDNIFKLNPAVGTVLAAIDGVEDIMATNEFDPRSVRRVDVGLVDWGVVMSGTFRVPSDVVTAQMSLGFSVALRLLTGRNDVDDYFNSQRWSDPQILAVAEKVEAHVMAIEGDMEPLGAEVTIELDDGRVLRSRQTAFRGHHTRRATAEELVQKFDSLVDGVLPADQHAFLRSSVLSLEELDDLGPFWNALVRPGAEGSS